MTAQKKARPNLAADRGHHRPRRSRAGFLAVLLELVSFSYFGRVFLVLLAAAILGLANILLSRNQLDLFFQLCGIEIILAAIAFWLRFILHRET